MKTDVDGQNPDGSKHIRYTLDGFSATIIDDLWTIYKLKCHFPLSLDIDGSVILIDTHRDLRMFTLGMQVAFQLCSL